MNPIRIIAIITVLTLTGTSFAFDCKVDGIYYNLSTYKNENTATVTNKSDLSISFYHYTYKGDVVIPESFEYNGITYKVTEVDSYAFAGCDKLKSVVIPNSVNIIDSNAFFDCSKLKSVVLPDTLITGLTERVFYGCSELKDIKWPSECFVIEQEAFCYCSSLESAQIPYGVFEIGPNAFKGCRNLSEVKLPRYLSDVSLTAFADCDNIKTVYIYEDQDLLAETIFDNHPRLIPYSRLDAINAKTPGSDVDTDIPESGNISNNVFAIVIANEEYRREKNVNYASNDGKIFADYLNMTLGIPNDNIIRLNNATLNDIKYGFSRISQLCEAFRGNASVILYYSGLGVSDELTKNQYLLPSDGYNSDMATCYPVNDLFNFISELPSEKNLVFLDTSFSGTHRNGDFLQNTRGVKLKPRKPSVKGNTIVFSAASDDETAYYDESLKHGLFTYYLLKTIKETKGKTTLGELFKTIKNNVTSYSTLKNKSGQIPVVICSPSIGNWENMKLK